MMPIPFLVGAAIAASGVVGAKKGIDAVTDTKKAKDVNKEADAIVVRAQDKLNAKRIKTNKSFEKLGEKKLDILSTSMKEFINEFEKIKNIDFKDSVGLDELRKLNFTGEALKDLKNASLEASKIMTGGVAALGTGVLTAFGAYSAVMTFGAATTGTAIASLSGVAATNATLAWLGGGALAAGGGGMALGTAVLGGLVAGPALAVGGIIMSSQAKKKLNDAYGNYEEARVMKEEMELAGTALNGMTFRADQMTDLLDRLNYYFIQSIANMKYVIQAEGILWSNYSQSSKQTIFASTKIAQVIKTMLDTSLIDEKGKLTIESKQALNDGRNYLDGNNIVSEKVDNTKTIANSKPSNGDKWTIGINGQQEGPYEISTIKQLIIERNIERNKCYVWKQGMPNWKLMSQVDEFIDIFNEVYEI